MPQHDEIKDIIKGFPLRDLVILAMAGFACEVVLDEMSELMQ